MKSALSLFTVLISSLLLSTGVSAQDNKQSTADIQFVKESHDFGVIKQTAPTSIDFVFKNTGKEPLVLSNVQASCGCTVPVWPKEPVMPGATAVITVSYNSNNLGIFSKTVTVTSNAKSGVKTLTIKGNVISEPKSPIILDQR